MKKKRKDLRKEVMEKSGRWGREDERKPRCWAAGAEGDTEKRPIGRVDFQALGRPWLGPDTTSTIR